MYLDHCQKLVSPRDTWMIQATFPGRESTALYIALVSAEEKFEADHLWRAPKFNQKDIELVAW